MKKVLGIFLSLTMCASLVLGNAITTSAHEEKTDVKEQIIWEFVDAVNRQDVDQYVSLFTDDIQDEMKDYLKANGSESTFAESHREILSIEKTECVVPEKEQGQFEDAVIYRVTEDVTYKENARQNTYALISGVATHDYVIVLENGNWRLYRVSAHNGVSGNRSLVEPIETFIYFTKSANISFYGSGSSGIYFYDYLKDVLPKEWYISHYVSYPHYGYASAMASKMYAWYCTENPKWDYYPYYACMKDNSSDQNYLINSYSNLATNYRNAEDAVLSYISNLAMVKSSDGSVFEVHYNASSGSYHSGTMSASGCLSKAQSGDLYDTILHYYYDNSTYVGTSNTASIVTY